MLHLCLWIHSHTIVKYFFGGGEQRGYRCPREYVLFHPYARNAYIDWANSARDSRDLYKKIVAQKFTHIFYNVREAKRVANLAMNRFTSAGLKNHNMFIKDYLRIVFTKSDTIVYEIK